MKTTHRTQRVITLFILPIFTIIFLSSIFGNGQMENIPVGVVDYTNSKLSREIIAKINASQSLNIGHRYTNEQEAHKEMQKLNIYGYLVIPPDFDEQLYSGKEPSLTYYYQKSLLATGEEVNGEFLTVLSDVAASLVEQSGMSADLTPAQAKAVAIPIEGNSFPIYNQDLDFTVYITYPFIFVFLQILLIVLIVYNLRSKSGDRRLLPYFIIFSIYSIAVNIICFKVLHIPLDNSLIIISIASLMLIAATISIGLIIALYIPNFSIAISIASMYGALDATMCGVTFPLEQMSPIIQVASLLFPVRYFTYLYHSIVYLNQSTIYSIVEIVPLILFIAPLLFIDKKKLAQRLCNTPSTKLAKMYGVLLIALGGTVGYSILYNILYLPDIVKGVPIAVVDESNTPLSRKYTRYLDATEGISIYASGINFKEAQKLINERKIRGIMYLPSNFSSKIYKGEESSFIIYGTTTSLLYYLTIQSSSTAAMIQLNTEYRSEIINNLTVSEKLALSQAPQINVSGVALYNKDGGYAKFLLPAVLIVALFQTMIMAIGVYKGGDSKKSDTSTITGFTSLYFLISLFVIGLIPIIFNLPNIGNLLHIFGFILLFLLVTAIFATLLSKLFIDSESVNLYIPFFSIGLIFLSGISFPRESMHAIWQLAYYIIPCPAGITGYIKLNSMGAELSAIHPEIITLTIQAIIYGCILYIWKCTQIKRVTV